jgi:large subunit ribosomal protein L10
MTREEKNQIIDILAEKLNENPNFYLTDISDLNVETTNNLSRFCFNKGVALHTVKNTLLEKAMVKTGRDYSELFGVLKGSTAIMFHETGNVPAKLIKDFRKTSPKPILKAAYVQECAYIGDTQLESLINIKSKNELIADVVLALKTPANNVVSALQSGKNKLAGIVKTLSER